jgi:hypothetical protein
VLSRSRSASSRARQAATPFERRRYGVVCFRARHRAAGLQNGRSGRRPALKPAPRAAPRGIDERTRSPGRLLEQPTESAHRFHPVRLIEPQPLHENHNNSDGHKYQIALPCQVPYEKASTARRSLRPRGPMKEVAVRKPEERGCLEAPKNVAVWKAGT